VSTVNDSLPPALTVGLPVRNGHAVLRRCIESVLSQDFADLELVVSDNVSDDGTGDLLDEYVRSDSRVMVNRNETNIGLHENLNRALGLSRGKYFRWISADDWLEPGCLTACVEALETHPEAIGVSTWFTIHTPDGGSRYEEYAGEFPTSQDPATRFDRMLWFFHAGDAKYDPIYSMYRRDALMRSGRLRTSEQTDWLLSGELALMGPIHHIARRLSNRSRSYEAVLDRKGFRRRLDPVHGEGLKSSARRLQRDLGALVAAADLDEDQRRRCRMSLRRLWVRDVASRTRANLFTVRQRMRMR
jgi:glycosyltransferase involved in cell wall biosynthesis